MRNIDPLRVAGFWPLVILLVVLSLLNGDYVTILFQFPWLLGGMFGFELLGAVWLHRIVSFDF